MSNAQITDAHTEAVLALDELAKITDQPSEDYKSAKQNLRDRIDILQNVAEEELKYAKQTTPDGKDKNGYPLGYFDPPAPDTIPGAMPPDKGMMPGSPRPENAVSTGITLGRDPNYSDTGDPAIDPKDRAAADQPEKVKKAAKQAESGAAPDQNPADAQKALDNAAEADKNAS